ncbi:MAG: hypothetical protein OEV21_01955 [Thermoplasmata archaeon]|nr:hypothetical protein [Thermoplasmata archaeon]
MGTPEKRARLARIIYIISYVMLLLGFVLIILSFIYPDLLR